MGRPPRHVKFSDGEAPPSARRRWPPWLRESRPYVTLLVICVLLSCTFLAAPYGCLPLLLSIGGLSVAVMLALAQEKPEAEEVEEEHGSTTRAFIRDNN